MDSMAGPIALAFLYGVVTPLYLFLLWYLSRVMREKTAHLRERSGGNFKWWKNHAVSACVCLSCVLVARLLYLALDPALYYAIIPNTLYELFYRISQPFMFAALVLVIDS